MMAWLFSAYLLFLIPIVLLMLFFVFFSTVMRLFSGLSQGSQNRKQTKIQQEQLMILRHLAEKEGIELPEMPTPWHQKQVDLPSLNLGINSLFAEDKGEDFRKQFLIEPAKISEEEKKIRQQLGMMGRGPYRLRSGIAMSFLRR